MQASTSSRWVCITKNQDKCSAAHDYYYYITVPDILIFKSGDIGHSCCYGCLFVRNYLSLDDGTGNREVKLDGREGASCNQRPSADSGGGLFHHGADRSEHDGLRGGGRGSALHAGQDAHLGRRGHSVLEFLFLVFGSLYHEFFEGEKNIKISIVNIYK